MCHLYNTQAFGAAEEDQYGWIADELCRNLDEIGQNQPTGGWGSNGLNLITRHENL